MRVMPLFGALVLTACAHASPEPPPLAPVVPAERAEIVRDENAWTADFTFDVQSPVWIFTRSALARIEKTSWRQLSWTVETPGVTLKRLGYYDAFVSASGAVPRQVRVRFKPYAADLVADYDPALAFTDGSTALFTEHYNAVPLASEEAAAALPIDLNAIDLPHGEPATVTFRDRHGDVMFGGRRHKSLTVSEGDGYVLFGKARVADAPSIATILDPQLPSWLSSRIAAFTPALLDFYGQRLGPRSGSKPTVMVSWAGPTPNLRSLGGSALPDLIIMRLEGDAVTKPNATVENDVNWFVAHESAHFWAGQTVHYGSSYEAWITEGAADLLANKAVGTLVAGFDSKARLQGFLDECLPLARKPIKTAGERGDNRAYYACGAMFALAADGGARRKGGDVFTFWRGLIEANRADETVTRDDWLGELTRLLGDGRAAGIIGDLLDKGSNDPTAAFASLFGATGVSHRLDADGKLVLE
jgi:hypothetical protein